jgi:hypothetical protein
MVTSKGVSPAAVAEPDSTPVFGSSAMPSGSVPFDTVYFAVPSPVETIGAS